MQKMPSAREVATWRKPGRYAVGHGVYLQVSAWHTRAWIFRYARGGKPRSLGLGSAEYVTLAEARARGFELRRQLSQGIDPLRAKRAKEAATKAAEFRLITFRQAATRYIAEHERSWRGDSSAYQWQGSLSKYVFDLIGDLPVDKIGKAEVTAVMDAAAAVPVTQRRLKNRLASILDFAHSRGWRETPENPASHRGLLPKKRKNGVRHLESVPYQQMPAFMAQLRAQEAQWARALELLILCANRPGEIMGARWSEFDLDAATWMIPGLRMKGGQAHRIPLSPRAVDILRGISPGGDLVFPGSSGGRAWPRMMNKVMKRIGRSEVVHGFRASFKTWASEQTAYPRELIEVALAHTLGSLDEAYRRSDMMERRRRLMTDWSEYCGRPSVEADVVPMRGRSQ
jgi:integrase